MIIQNCLEENDILLTSEHPYLEKSINMTKHVPLAVYFTLENMYCTQNLNV